VRSYQPINQYIHILDIPQAKLTNDPSGHGLKLPVLDARLMILCDAITAGENVSIVARRRTIPYKLTEIETKSVHHGS
jgi:hypothetical protein